MRIRKVAYINGSLTTRSAQTQEFNPFISSMSNRDYYGDYTPENFSSQDKTQQFNSMQNSEFLPNQVISPVILTNYSATDRLVFSRTTSNNWLARIPSTNKINGRILTRLRLKHRKASGVLAQQSSVEQE